jgi:hypothetical protein
MAFFLAPGCSYQFPGILGAEEEDVQDGSWRRCFVAWVYLAAKPSHVGVDLDGLAYLLHHPMVYSHQTRGHSLLSSVVLSHHSCGRWRFFGDLKPPELGYLVIDFYKENIIFTRISLPYVKVIMVFRHVSQV